MSKLKLTSNKDALKRLKQIECPDATYTEIPLIIDKAKGYLIWDVEGKEYIDLCAGFGSLPLGHNHKSLNINHQNVPTNGMGDIFASRAKIDLLNYLTNILPSHLTKGSLSITGAGAIEFAIKTALLSTGKPGIIAFKNCYHGLHLSTLSLTHNDFFKKHFLSWIPQQNVSYCKFACPTKSLETGIKTSIDNLKQRGIDTGAVIVEPIQGRAGVIIPSEGWLYELRTICDKYNLLLIFDEIFTGLGRSGRLCFAGEIPCDILCLGKSLGGGLPLSACFTTSKIMNHWPENYSEAIHTGTFYGHPLSCKQALNTLKLIINLDLCKNSMELGTLLRKELTKSLDFPIIKEIRGAGLMNTIEFNRPKTGIKVMKILLNLGIIAIPGGPSANCINITPPLNITRDIIYEITARFNQAIKRLQNETPF